MNQRKLASPLSQATVLFKIILSNSYTEKVEIVSLGAACREHQSE